jgi:hypothetical protein
MESSRSRRIRSSVSSTIDGAIGWPVRSTGTPSSRSKRRGRKTALADRTDPSGAETRERSMSLMNSSSDKPLAWASARKARSMSCGRFKVTVIKASSNFRVTPCRLKRFDPAPGLSNRERADSRPPAWVRINPGIDSAAFFSSHRLARSRGSAISLIQRHGIPPADLVESFLCRPRAAPDNVIKSLANSSVPVGAGGNVQQTPVGLRPGPRPEPSLWPSTPPGAGSSRAVS